MKHFSRASAMAFAILLGSACTALAQLYIIPGVPPANGDNKASPGSVFAFDSTQHTGTDAMVYTTQDRNDPNRDLTIQAMTWDSKGKVILSWSFYKDYPSTGHVNDALYSGSSYGSLQVKGAVPGDKLSDPDVVMAAANDSLYLNLVYIENTYPRYEVYCWNPVANAFQFRSGQRLGSMRPAYTHSYPNIDANALGVVAITWQQSVTDKVTVKTTSGGGYFPAFTSPPYEVSFSRTYLAGSTITGNIASCYTDGTTIGVLALDPPTGLFEQTLHPDVAISEGNADNAVISSTYLRHYVDGHGQFSIVNKLAVRQFRYNYCVDGPLDTLATYEWDYSAGDAKSAPRIAASSAGITKFPRPFGDRGTDVEVVVDRTLTACVGPPSYAVLDFGKTGDVFRPNYTLVTAPTPSNPLESVEPVVTYNVEGYYTVTWTGGPDTGGNQSQYNSKASGEDVWALSLKEGHFIFVTGAGPASYSRVNDHADGRQAVSSIAGRHLSADVHTKKAGAVHLFLDAKYHILAFKRSNELGGDPGAALRPATGTGASGGNIKQTNARQVLDVFPNPASDAVSIRLDLQAKEKVLQLEVRDLLGRPVANLLSGAGTEVPEIVTWTPATNLPAGNYTVRVVTSQRTQAVVVNRN